MQNKPIYLWPFIFIYRLVMIIFKIPLAIIHYFLLGIFFSFYTVANILIKGGLFISLVWWKFLKIIFKIISFPFVYIYRLVNPDKKNKSKQNVNKTKEINVKAETKAIDTTGKTAKEIARLKKIDEKEAAKHAKKMAELKKKEDIRIAKEKEKLEKINKQKEAEAIAKQKADAEAELKEQQRLLKQAQEQEALQKKQKENISATIGGTTVSGTLTAGPMPTVQANVTSADKKKSKNAAAEEKKRLKEEKIKRKKELREERKKLKEKNVYVNENVKIEKQTLGDKINNGLEKVIKGPQKFANRFKKGFAGSALARNKKNTEELHREALLIDFTGEDAEKSSKKVVYEYVGKNADGKLVKSYFEAFSKVEVHSFLLSEGFEVYSIKTSPLIQFLHGTRESSNGKFKSKDLIFFLTQLSTYIKAGIPLVESLRILSRQFSQANYQKIFRSMIYDLTMGDNFSIAMEKQGNAFPKLLVNMIKASEMTGELPETLDDMQVYFEESEKTRKQMITALTYPTIVLVLALAAVTFIMIYIVPQFVQIYADMDNAELPGITVMILNISNFMKSYWIYLIAGIVIIVFIFTYLFKNVKLFRTLIQWFLMKLPIVGDVIIFNEVTMFTKTFASLLKHNVFITDTMEILNKITNNEIWKMIILDTITNLAKGEKISLAFQDHWAVPVPAYEMIVTGERTGQLPEMMQKVSDYYQELHKNSVSRIKSFVEPILILFLVGVVGVIVLSIVIPMFDMYSQLS